MDSKEKSLNRAGWKYFAKAFLSQYVVLIICLFLHRTIVALGGLIEVSEQVGGEISKPTAGRLIFALCAAAAFFILSFLASEKSKEGKIFTSFILGAFAGTNLWQCIGEDLWHFSIGGEHFVTLESVSVLPLVIVFIASLLYFWRNNSLDWGIWCVVLAFAVNWLGHFVQLGTYPFFKWLCDETTWCMISGAGLGTILIIVSVYLEAKKAKTEKQTILTAILCYYATAILAFGIMGG